MNPTDAKKLHLSTDYPFDKILETFSGNFTAAARFGVFDPRRTTHLLNHNVDSWGLIVGVFSTNGTDWLPLGISNADTSGSLPSFQTVEVTAFCTSTQVGIMASNYLSSSQNVRYALQIMARD